MDQKAFMRQMEDLVDFGKTKEGRLTKGEIADYCSDLSLTKEQLELVYAYLMEHHIEVSGYEVKEGDFSGTDAENEEKKKTPDSKYLRIYRKEIRELPDYTKEDIEALYQRLRMGDEEVVSEVIESHLPRVLTLAGRYRGRGVLLEDLIQEGNLELVTCVSGLFGNREVVDFKKAIDYAICGRLIELVDEQIQDMDGISEVLARTNLLLEATRVLAEEYGRIATIEELSEFTRMEIEEIQMYVDLSRDKIELGKGEP